MVENAEFPIEYLGPVTENGVGCDAVGDPEGNVNVGPVVLGANRRGAGKCARCDP